MTAELQWQNAANGKSNGRALSLLEVIEEPLQICSIVDHV